MANGLVHVNLIILFTFKRILVEFIAEIFIIVKIISNKNILYYSVNNITHISAI